MSDWHYYKEFLFDGDVYEGELYSTEEFIYFRDEIQYKEDDILAVTYPKAGTTWIQEIIWLLHHGPGSADKREKSFDHVFPYLEFNFAGNHGLELIKTLPQPRFMKTHFAAKFFQRQLDNEDVTCPRFVVVLRNPKDLLLSYYKFHKMWAGDLSYSGDWNDFFQIFKDNRLEYGDYIEHALSWWKYRDHPKVHIVKYDDLKKSPHENMRKIGEFLGKSTTDDVLDAVVEESSFETMKKRPMEKISVMLSKIVYKEAEFFRKGETGGAKDVFTEEQIDYVDDMVARKWKPVGLEFD